MQLVYQNIIEDNPYQTRQTYDDIEELALDIKQTRERLPETMGLLQVPMARKVGKVYQLAFGHRRKRAFFYLFREDNMGSEWSVMPLIVADLTDQQMADYAWSENEKRRDISAIERATAIERARTEFGYSLTEIAERWGMSKSAASNTTRLLLLPEAVREMVQSGQLPERHARELLPLVQVMDLPKEAAKLARHAVDGGWSAEATRTKAVQELYNKGLSNLDKFNEFDDWGDLLPDGCLYKCYSECPHFATLDKEPKCTNGELATAKEVAYRQRLEQLASIKFNRPISRACEIDPEGLAVAQSYNGGCTNLCVGYIQWGYRGTPVDEENFPNIYFTCSEGYKCECRQGARQVQAEATNPNYAKLQEWRGKSKEKAFVIMAQLREDLTNGFYNAMNRLNAKDQAFFVALLKQCNRQCGYNPQSIAEAATDRVMSNHNGFRINHERHGNALLFDAQIRQLTLQGTPLHEVEARLQSLDDLIAESELAEYSPSEHAINTHLERITEILDSHPGHEPLRQRFAELQQKLEGPSEEESKAQAEAEAKEAVSPLPEGEGPGERATEAQPELEEAVPAWLAD